MELWISMNRDGLRAFAERLLIACDARSVEVELEAKHNLSGKALTVRFDNEDMEGRDDVTAYTVLWEQA